MAASDSFSEILPWLKTLPLAPEYHPTISEFQDPISYILKIEKEASKFGICKIVPPVPPPPRKTAISNLSRSLSSRNPNPNKSPTFTTRQQQIGFCPRRTRPVQKPVWQSGENYTLEQFEAKAKHFERSHLRKSGKRPPRSALEIETLFWKACADKPFSVEYANDMAGSAFAPVNSEKRTGETVGETAWNMRGVSRAKGSLLRFMKEEIPGVTSPMVYVAMMFSWFAWHVEDHDLHSLNYMHLGAAKTWYGVPKDAAVAFEEVVRVHGYGGEVNPLVTFATLGEKTTVMSPEVLINAGVPCCRLVQNAGEFVVTFPRAYHSGFSHGFNCGEAANIATPEWLRVAKEAAIRRASINYPPMVSHFQLLYALALNLCSRVSTDVSSEPWSPRLKNKKKDEGEMMVKEQFMQNVIQNNDLLHMLMEKGSSCILLPQNSSDISLSSKSGVGLGYQIMVKHKSSLDLCSSEEAMVASKVLFSDDIMPERNMQHKNLSDLCSAAQKSISLLCEGKRVPSVKYSRYGNADLYTSPSHSKDMGSGEEGATFRGTGLNQGLLSCVTCGILNFACVAVIQPTEAAARYLVSSDCNFLDDHIVASDLNSDRNSYSSGLYSLSGQEVEDEDNEELVDVLIKSDVYQFQVANRSVEPASDTLADNDLSALDLLASTYADSSDSEGEPIESEMSTCGDGGDSIVRSSLPAFCSLRKAPREDAEFRLCDHDPCQEDNVEVPISVDSTNFEGTYRNSTATSARILSSREVHCSKSACGNLRAIPIGFTHSRDVVCRESDGWYLSCTEIPKSRECDAELDSEGVLGKGIFDTSEKNSYMPFVLPSDKDSSRMHIFCLEHAVEVERQLHPIGGVKMLLLCHPDYPKLEDQAKSLAEEMGINYCWNDISFREATAEDKAKIRTALDDEEVIPGNRDWAVKLGVNLYYSSNLSKSPLYCKQMPYNSVIYRVFGRDSPYNSPTKPRIYSKRGGKQKKLVVAGKWCGKVWMSNQVHPYLARRDPQEREPIKGFKSQSTDRKVEIRQEFENSVPTVAPDSIRQGRKRDIPFETVRLKKLKLQQSENIRADEDSDENLPPHCGRTLQSGTVRHERPVKNTEQIHSNLKNKIEGGLSTRLRKRPSKMMEAYVEENGSDKIRKNLKKPPSGNKNMNNTDASLKDEESEYQCNIEGCSMGFSSKNDLVLHKRNVCPVKGCGKKFFSHKYLVQHRRVHLDARPLKCPWKGCKMSFKWAWARTEHIRVHTGARPYVCRETGCGQTFRFVSDFSRHKRKTGHSAKKRRG